MSLLSKEASNPHTFGFVFLEFLEESPHRFPRVDNVLDDENVFPLQTDFEVVDSLDLNVAGDGAGVLVTLDPDELHAHLDAGRRRVAVAVQETDLVLKVSEEPIPAFEDAKHD